MEMQTIDHPDMCDDTVKFFTPKHKNLTALKHISVIIAAVFIIGAAVVVIVCTVSNRRSISGLDATMASVEDRLGRIEIGIGQSTSGSVAQAIKSGHDSASGIQSGEDLVNHSKDSLATGHDDFVDLKYFILMNDTLNLLQERQVEMNLEIGQLKQLLIDEKQQITTVLNITSVLNEVMPSAKNHYLNNLKDEIIQHTKNMTDFCSTRVLELNNSLETSRKSNLAQFGNLSKSVSDFDKGQSIGFVTLKDVITSSNNKTFQSHQHLHEVTAAVLNLTLATLGHIGDEMSKDFQTLKNEAVQRPTQVKKITSQITGNFQVMNSSLAKQFDTLNQLNVTMTEYFHNQQSSDLGEKLVNLSNMVTDLSLRGKQRKCFKMETNEKVSWREAVTRCEELGGSIAEMTVANINTFNFIKHNVHKQNLRLWLGASDIGHEGKWTWWSGRLAPNSGGNWSPGQPSNGAGRGEHCMEIWRDGSWNDAPCDLKLGYMCQKFCQDKCADWQCEPDDPSVTPQQHLMSSVEDGMTQLTNKINKLSVILQEQRHFYTYNFPTIIQNLKMSLINESIDLKQTLESQTLQPLQQLKNETSAILSEFRISTVDTNQNLREVYNTSIFFFNETLNQLNVTMTEYFHNQQSLEFSEKLINLSNIVPDLSLKGKQQRRCFKVETNSKVSWREAARRCAAFGGNIAEMSAADTKTFNFIKYNIHKQNLRLWLGASDIGHEGKWTWWSGRLAPNSGGNWSPGQPSNGGGGGEHCMEIWRDGSWNDAPCDLKLGYVCQKFCQDSCKDWTCEPEDPSVDDGVTQLNDKITHLSLILQDQQNLQTSLVNETIDLKKNFESHVLQSFTKHLENETSNILNELKSSAVDTRHKLRDDYNRSTVVFKETLNQLNVTMTEYFHNQQSSELVEKLANLSNMVSDLSLKGKQRKCFKMETDQKVSWRDAVRKCAELGGSLAEMSPADTEAFNFIKYNIHKNNLRLWLGASDIGHEGEWTWLSGQPAPNSGGNWDYGEPSNGGGGRVEHCMVIWRDGSWHDVACEVKNGYVCQSMCQDPRTGWQCVPQDPLLTSGQHSVSSVEKSVTSLTNNIAELMSMFNSTSSLSLDRMDRLASSVSELTSQNINFSLTLKEQNNFNSARFPEMIQNLQISLVNESIDLQQRFETRVLQPLQQLKNETSTVLDGFRSSFVDTRSKLREDYNQTLDWLNVTMIQQFTQFSQKPINLSNIIADLCSKGKQRKCFKVVTNSKVSWRDAVKQCGELGGSLAEMSERKTFHFIKYNIHKKNLRLWLGASDIGHEGVWTWLSGKPAPNSGGNWYPGEPNNGGSREHCMEIWKEGTWNDATCGAKFGYVCQKYGQESNTDWQCEPED